MKSESDFRALYESRLKARLESLESTRKKVLQRYGLGFLLIVVLVAWNYLLATLNPPDFLLIASVALSATGAIWYIIVTWKRKRAYRQIFKSEVVAEIVRLFDPNWNYSADLGITQADYGQSGLFRHQVDRYQSEDMVSGSIDKTDFQFSEIHSEYKQVTHGTKGERREHWVTIFRGLFMHADFNKNFLGTTYVLPDTAERILGAFGQSLQKLSLRGDLVKLENVEFEKRFVVYSSDQVEARYILTPAIMEAMVDMATRFGNDVFFSFVGTRVYFARSFSVGLFEPNVFRSGVNYHDMKEMFGLFGMISVLVQELNLNTRIWTKA